MPELPDIAAYISALDDRIVGRRLERVRVANPFLLRTAEPPLSSADGRVVRELRRIGKRIAIGLEGDLWLVIHLMIAGRLHWRAAGAKLAGRNALAALDFENGSLVLTEAGTKRRASLHVLSGEAALAAVDPGGIDAFATDLDGFRTALTTENRTLKRALTDPRTLSGVGNAYSDEILFEARLLPLRRRASLKPPEEEALYEAIPVVLKRAVEAILANPNYDESKQDRSFMAVHMKGGKTCPRCGHRISQLGSNREPLNFCRGCQL